MRSPIRILRLQGPKKYPANIFSEKGYQHFFDVILTTLNFVISGPTSSHFSLVTILIYLPRKPMAGSMYTESKSKQFGVGSQKVPLSPKNSQFEFSGFPYWVLEKKGSILCDLAASDNVWDQFTCSWKPKTATQKMPATPWLLLRLMAHRFMRIEKQVHGHTIFSSRHQ